MGGVKPALLNEETMKDNVVPISSKVEDLENMSAATIAKFIFDYKHSDLIFKAVLFMKLTNDLKGTETLLNQTLSNHFMIDPTETTFLNIEAKK